MIISLLLEDRHDEIISPNFVRFVETLVRVRFNSSNSGRIKSTVDSHLHYIKNRWDSFSTDSICAAWLLYARSNLLQVVCTDLNISEHDWIPNGLFVSSLPPEIQKYASRIISSVPWELMQRSREQLINITEDVIHFKGNRSGTAQPVNIPAIANMRIRPNDFLPDIIAQFKVLEKAYVDNMLSNIDQSKMVDTINDVPTGYIHSSKTKAELILSYEVDGVKSGWFTLGEGSNGSREEANAMGHCASNGSCDTLLSFRSIVQFFVRSTNSFETFFFPNLTAAVKDDTLYELRGRGNSKPAEKYHPYIKDLILKYPINRLQINSSYNRSSQFYLTDLDEEDQKEILSQRPNMVSPLEVVFGDYDFEPEQVEQALHEVFAELEMHMGITIDESTSSELYAYGTASETTIEIFDYYISDQAIDKAIRKDIVEALNKLDELKITFEDTRVVPDIVHSSMSMIIEYLKNLDYANGRTATLISFLRKFDTIKPSSKLYKHLSKAISKFYYNEFKSKISQFMDIVESIVNRYSSYTDVTYYVKGGSSPSDHVQIQIGLQDAYNSYYDGSDNPPSIENLFYEDSYRSREDILELFKEDNTLEDALVKLADYIIDSSEDHLKTINPERDGRFLDMFTQHDLFIRPIDVLFTYIESELNTYNDFGRYLNRAGRSTGKTARQPPTSKT